MRVALQVYARATRAVLRGRGANGKAGAYPNVKIW